LGGISSLLSIGEMIFVQTPQLVMVSTGVLESVKKGIAEIESEGLTWMGLA
jgi:hypothetical protein